MFIVMTGGDEMKLYTLKQAAEMLGVSRWTIYKAIEKGQIKAVTISDRRRIPQTELERLTEAKKDDAK